MNSKTRKELGKVVKIINDLKEILSTIIDQEQTKFDNLPEGIQHSENGSKLEEAATTLEEAINSLDEAIDNIETVTM